ncbi:MAG: alpha/beta hydrolase [Betaproteobacteria bacterium RIFCSPLOWO2_12_FULL_65_14]|nr:MAG: alpha/beta hydrolase [Betaproteobacteria bacterium RIFCSPLOWO2_12_FULL_65_14]
MIIAEELFARKGAVKLAVWRKRPVSQSDHPVVVLVHGSSTSARPTFDLAVPGKAEYSMMDWFTARGFDCWAMDHEGYGRSTVTQSNSDVRCGVEDLRHLIPLIEERTGRKRVLMYGLSSGALRAGAFAAACPDAVERLALDAFVWTGEGSPTLAKRKEGVEQFRSQARRPISEAFIESIFTRDYPGLYEPEVAKACAAAQLSYGDSVPSGTYLDMTTALPQVDPAAVRSPTLIVRPQHDGVATVEDLLAFFARLPSADKQFVMIPGLTHASTFGIHRRRMWHAVLSFFSAGALGTG